MREDGGAPRKRGGLQRGLADIPSERPAAAGVLERVAGATVPEKRPTLRVVEPPPAAPPVMAPVVPHRPRAVAPKIAAHSKRASEAARLPSRAPRAAPTRPRRVVVKERAARPAPKPATGQAPETAARPAVKGERPPARAFYERLGWDVTKLVAKTIGQVLRAGFGPEELFPQLFRKLTRGFGDLPGRVRDQVASALRAGEKCDYLDPEMWQGLFYLLRSSAEMKIETYKRRRAGDYEVDEFGLDMEYLERVQPLFRFMYKNWWRVKATGLEHVPATGRALLVANHSGVLPWDGGMIATAVFDLHPSPRLVRALHLEWFTSLPFVAPFLQKTGQVLANHENGERLLRRGHLVTVFPEGLKGVGKHWSHRYQLARFGRGGFVKMAIAARAPIIPVSVVGAEEIHPVLLQMDFISKPLGLPYLPLTPTFPLLGPLGLIPLPSNWRIHFGEPIDTSVYTKDDANDFHLVSQISDYVRSEVQKTIHDLLRQRGPAFGGRR